jgi:transposase, IS30 family
MASQLNIGEREQIAQFHSHGLCPAEIGRRLGRHRTTIGRELARNSEGGVYWASEAQQKALSRRARRRRKLDDSQVDCYVRERLVKLWSPEQIAGMSRRQYPQERRRQFSYTTVYRWIAGHPDRSYWESFLRFGRQRKEPEKRGRLPARAEIAGRPAIVDQRRRFGDWEGDTVVGQGRRGGVVTLVERKSGFALAGKVQRLKAQNVTRCVKGRFATLPEALRRTMTFDNGKEFADHESISQGTNLDIYFARPYHAWERGSNESFNGLLRQFFPKGTDLAGKSPLEVKRVLDLLNDRPRKRLGYRTPREVLGKRFPVAFQM